MKGAEPHKRTRIVATLGPASRDYAMVRKLSQAGVDVFRLNLSHGAPDEHALAVKHIRAAGAATGTFPGILADLQGPKIRTGRTENDAAVTLKQGSTVTITSRHVVCTDRIIAVDFPGLVSSLRKGQRMLLNDGAVALRVISVKAGDGTALAEVTNTGVYSSRKGINVPGTRLAIPAITSKDRRDLAFALKSNIPIIALSFVRSADDLRRLQALVRKSGKKVKLIAKIEKPEAVDRIGEILEECDGIMVARGDLGIELSPHELPVVQKDLIAAANRRGRLVIVATQMLESMIQNPLPTRAESADVANAILDGADAVMLSGETSVGKYPVEAVSMMTRIALATEKSGYYDSRPRDLSIPGRPFAHAMCEAAAWASQELRHAPALVFTLSGDTALYLSKIRYFAPIYAFTPSPATASMLSLAWNVRSFVVPFQRDLTGLERLAERVLLKHRLVRRGEQVLVLSGSATVRGATDILRAKRVEG